MGQLRFSLLFGSAHEEQQFPVWRPAWRCIVIAFCQLVRLLAARDRHRPDRRVVAFFLLVNCNADKCDTRSIRRNLRVSDPDKIEQIFFSNVALLRRDDGCRRGPKDDDE